jgi:hypothetical protein
LVAGVIWMITVTHDNWLQHVKQFKSGPKYKFETGGVVKWRGVMESGKTIGMMATYKQLRLDGFKACNAYGNMWLNDPGFHYCTNEELRAVVRKAFNTEIGQWRQIVILMMEADSVYSHKDYSEKELTEDLRGFSQAMKLNNWFIYEMHEGAGVLKLLRDKTEISIKPTYYRDQDVMHLSIINGHYNQLFENWIYQPSRLHGSYLRFDIIK